VKEIKCFYRIIVISRWAWHGVERKETRVKSVGMNLNILKSIKRNKIKFQARGQVDFF
jgi:hypothetical protein